MTDGAVANERGPIEAAVFEERNRIAREIHDTLAQVFTGMLLQIRVARRIAAERPIEAWELIGRVADLAQHGLAEARRSVWSLQPEAAEYADLAGAVRSAVERARPGTSATLELHVDGSVRPVDPGLGHNLLRIIEEALTNALRHASPTMVWVEVAFGHSDIRIRIQDDGKGFDVARQRDQGGFGLISMGQRAERMGGKLTVLSRPGRGAEVSAIIPTSPGVGEEDS